MTHETEAEALLRSGRLFSRRVGLRSRTGHLTFIGIKQGSFAIYRADQPYYHFDLDGRWQRAFIRDRHYLRSLSGSIDAMDRVREGSGMVLLRRELTRDEANALDASIRVAAIALAEECENGDFDIVEAPDGCRSLSLDEIHDLLNRVAQWDSAAWNDQRERYAQTYAPMGLLPPDTRNAVVLQATLGDTASESFRGGCPPHQVARGPAEFEAHVRSVIQLLGRRLAQYRAVFLGGSDVVRRPIEEVIPWFEIIRNSFPISPSTRVEVEEAADRPEDVRLAGIDTYLDEFAPPLPERRAWNELKRLGLRRVNLGVESGDPAIRESYGRMWNDGDLRRLVDDLKAEGIAASLLVLVGAGGRERAARHLEETTRLLGELPLGRGDVIYLIDASEVPGPSRVGSPWELVPVDMDTQREEFRTRLKTVASGSAAKVVTYSPRKQGY